MKKYRLTLILAALLIVWLIAGPQLISRLTSTLTYTTGLPAGVSLTGRLFFTQGFGGVWQVALPAGTVSQWWQPPDEGLVMGIAASPDGQQFAIAYAPPAAEGFQSGTTDLYLSGSAAPNAQPLLTREVANESFRNPFWSPDGRWLYYTHLKPILKEDGTASGVELTVERIEPGDTGAAEVVLHAAEQASLSPDGQQIVFLQFDPKTYSRTLTIANLDGSRSAALIPAGAYQALAGPKFDPSGGVLVSASGDLQIQAASAGIVRAHGLPWNILHVINSDQTPTKLTPFTLDGPWLDWSPDGQDFAVLSAEGVFVVHEGQFYRVADSSGEGEITWAGGS
ncbi:MAG: hypothetical protein K8J31_19510 [Anaerolineae bacterium]|nr:hypothetical protein [Anaerolineae bacterium]